MIDIKKHPEYDNHELVKSFHDKKTGLKGFVAIHNTALGPAVGGTRFFPYKSEAKALEDVLRLSRGMTYKCAISKVPFGGGKAVIIADPKSKKTKKFLESYAKEINLFNGGFFTGEDMGMTLDDIKILSKHCPFIIGAPERAGDPSPWAALGVFYAIKESVKVLDGKNSLKGYKVAIKGLGKVGIELARLLTKEGASLIGADVDKEKTKEFLRRFPKSQVVAPSIIHKQKVDIYAPCALGHEFNTKTIKELNCRIICGAANNQLSKPEHGLALYKRNILYIPDYLANAGGLVNVVAELDKNGYNENVVLAKIKEIQKTVRQVILLSKKNKQPTNVVADAITEQFIFKNTKRVSHVHGHNTNKKVRQKEKKYPFSWSKRVVRTV